MKEKKICPTKNFNVFVTFILSRHIQEHLKCECEKEDSLSQCVFLVHTDYEIMSDFRSCEDAEK